MIHAPATAPRAARNAAVAGADNRPQWLVLAQQLPASPSNLRVRTWRRLQQIGAVAVKQAVHVLPDSAEAREDFAWLSTEIAAGGGSAAVFVGCTLDAWTDDQLIEQFRRARQEDYAALADDVGRLLARVARTSRRPTGRAPAARRRLHQFRQRLEAIERIDYFDAAGRDRVVDALRRLDAAVVPRRSSAPDRPDEPPSGSVPRGSLWVTRPRPGVDRMASAWLIRRFIDAEARFDFADGCDSIPAGAVAFDMAGVEFGHHGDRCTFETLLAAFRLDAPELTRIAALVHDLDLKDERFGAPEAATIGVVIDGLRLAHDDDGELMDRGMTLFEALHRSFQRAARAARPRRVAGPRASRNPRHGTSTRRRKR